MVARSGRERADGFAEPAAHALVRARDPARGGERRAARLERHRADRRERALQSPERVAPEVRVLRDAGRDERMGHLEQQRAPAAEQHRGLATHAPQPAVVAEQTLAIRKRCVDARVREQRAVVREQREYIRVA